MELTDPFHRFLQGQLVPIIWVRVLAGNRELKDEASVEPYRTGYGTARKRGQVVTPPGGRLVFKDPGGLRGVLLYLIRLQDPEEAFRRVEQNQRRLIRRAGEEGLTLRSDDDFDALFRLHEDTHQRKGAPIYLPQDRFRVFFRTLAEQGLVENSVLTGPASHRFRPVGMVNRTRHRTRGALSRIKHRLIPARDEAS